jgi:hypothetical protein
LQANTFFAGNAFHQKNSQQQESFKLPISRRWRPEEEQPISTYCTSSTLSAKHYGMGSIIYGLSRYLI